MTIIAVLNPKGGSGKITMTIKLARALHDRGTRILLVDTDPQGSETVKVFEEVATFKRLLVLYS